MTYPILSRAGKCLREDREGVATIEFAIVANLFIFLVTCLAGFGMYLSASHSLQQISAEAARSAVAGLTVEEQTKLVADYIAQYGGEYPFLQSAQITGVVTHPSSSVISVSVSYDVSDLPVMGMLTGLPIPHGTITANTNLRLGVE